LWAKNCICELDVSVPLLASHLSIVIDKFFTKPPFSNRNKNVSSQLVAVEKTQNLGGSRCRQTS